MTTTVTADDVGRADRRAVHRALVAQSASASRFWVLLVLASVIATAPASWPTARHGHRRDDRGAADDPILGIALAVVIGDRPSLVRSVLYVLGGGLLVVAIAFTIGLVATHPTRTPPTRRWPGASAPPHRPRRGAGHRHLPARSPSCAATSATRCPASRSPSRSCRRSRWSACCSRSGATPTRRRRCCCSAPTSPPSCSPAPSCWGSTACGPPLVASGTPRRSSVVPFAAVVGLVVLVAVPLSIGTLNVVRDQRVTATAKPVAQSWAARRLAGEHHRRRQRHRRRDRPRPAARVDVAALRGELDRAGLTGNEPARAPRRRRHRLCAAGSTTCTAPPTSLTVDAW